MRADLLTYLGWFIWASNLSSSWVWVASPPHSRSGRTNGDSSSSESVQSLQQRRHPQPHTEGVREPDWEKEVKRDIPEFLGTDSTDEIIDWLTLVNEVFEHRNVPKERRVGIIAMRFRGKAIAWWRREKQTRHSACKDPITRWIKMEDKIRKYFLPKGYKRDLYQWYQNLRQRTRTVDQYTNEFNELVIRNNIQEVEEMLVNKYLRGLQLHIQDTLDVLDIWDLGDAHQRALKVERLRSRKQQSTSFTNQAVQGSVGTTKAGNTSAYPTSINKAPTQPKVFNQPPHTGQSSTTSIRCYSCGEIGHRASNYRKRQAGKSLVVENKYDDPGEEDANIDPKDDESNSEDEQVLNADTCELLMMRKFFLTPKQEAGNRWLRNNIFHSACTVSGKAAANKLKLELKEHPNPYKMSWLKRGMEVTVSKRCLVNLSIASIYFDRIWCDVIPMDCSHIILGRPWQFDKKTIHDGYCNTYSFDYGGKKITLAPSKEPIQTPLVENSPSSNFLVMKDVKSAMEGVSVIYILFNKSDIGDVVAPIIPNQVKPLLEQFKDVFPLDLPSGLPPMRDIQHQIDLLPDASSPNLAQYQMSPLEHEELQRQIMELFNKGFIRESLSSFAVPAFLVPKKNGTWRMCVDSRAINKITIKYRFPIPCLDDLLDQLSGATIFSKLDLKSGYNQI
ncbi:uncharacterized protein LOC143859443 [Tasmannia lanceolata]|uniref:uncharacterized protein LOC143859443 n=1 Tax=Tasmannia lanceolata TaxID=3420 RepID=UPI004064AB45